ncbi:MAG: U32 family peptidase [Ruminococcaceae bacterium]|nr:U32 family peptidase [Oscillospiraceae bacterium]
MMETRKPDLPELLAPAGSVDSLRAALAAGADAVYFGGTSFSNRMRAKNFGDSELTDAIRLCHSVGAAAHITVNTRVRDREMDEILRLADTLLNVGDPDASPDALIVADFGIAREIHRRYPEIALHASTQTSFASPADCRMLAEMGFTRLVIPRELSRTEIRRLCEQSPLEIEMFIHGAHCVSCSGQCLMSYTMGGRSGNRGECAQPCRLPFAAVSTDNGADSTKKRPGNRDSAQNGVLSLADMCLAGRIPEVIGTGVRSLKIEGRLKSAAYVYGTTKIYRTLLDERRRATEAEVKELAKLFSRGFTDGYFTNNYSKMSSIQVSGDVDKAPADRSAEITKALDERIRAHAVPETTVPLTGEFRLTAGEPARFTLSLKDTPDCTATVTGEPPQTASGNPITPGSAAKNLTKFGGTEFSLSAADIDFDIGANLWYPVSALNALRRSALAALEAVRPAVAPADTAAEAKPRENSPELLHYIPESIECPSKKQLRTAEISDIRTLSDPSVLREFFGYFDTIYVPAHLYGKAADVCRSSGGPEPAAVLPVYSPSDEVLRHLLDSLKQAGCARVLCHSVGQIHLVEKCKLSADLSFRANITNTSAFAEYRTRGCERILLSPELPAAAVEDIGGGTMIYGRLPLMTLARCVICGGKCPHGNRGGRAVIPDNYTLSPNSNITKIPRGTCCTALLRDRKGEEFPVIGVPDFDCVNVVYNSVPTWMADRSEQWKHIPHVHFLFTVESSKEAADVVRAYIEKRPHSRSRRL